MFTSVADLGVFRGCQNRLESDRASAAADVDVEASIEVFDRARNRAPLAHQRHGQDVRGAEWRLGVHRNEPAA